MADSGAPAKVLEVLGRTGVRLVLYPLSAFRAMSAAALAVYEAVRRDGSQRAVLDLMQTREALYEVLGYHAYERTLDEAPALSPPPDRATRHGI